MHAAADLAEPMRGGESLPASHAERSLKEAVAELERGMISAVLEKSGHNQQQAARLLGLSRQGLIKKLKRYGIAARAK